MELEPADLQPIHKLHKEGKFPPDMNLRYILEGLCTPGRILCVKIRGQWNTTEAAIHAWIADNANLPFKGNVRQTITPLIVRFGKDPIDVVGVQELDGWFHSLALKYSPETMHNYWRRTRHFFAHCHDFGFIVKNPFAILKEPARREKRKRHILKPEHMAKCLEAAKDDRSLTAYLCLGGFAGIRTSEILKMDWDD